MGRRSNQYIRDNNQVSEGGTRHMRKCMHCTSWKALAEFKKTHGQHGYSCYPCERDKQREREAIRPSRVRKHRHIATHSRIQQFDETRVDIQGLLRFSTMPTPAQLLARMAA